MQQTTQTEYTATILIVDDELIGRETLEALLLPLNCNLVFASSGKEAIEKATLHRPDLMLLDVMMPGMDGYEVCRRVRGMPYLAEVPIVMVTALDDRDSRLEGIAAGADDFIAKPFDRNEMRLRVRSITRLNRYRRLLDERERFDRMVELSPDGLLLVQRTGHIQLANTAIRMMLYHNNPPTQHVALNTIQQWIEETQHTYVMTCIEHVIDEMTHMCFETFVVRASGTRVPVELHMGYLAWQGHHLAQMIVRDITSRKDAEQEQIRLLEQIADREHRLQDLVEKLITSQEEERRRVAYELHDGLAQVATGLLQRLQTFAAHYSFGGEQDSTTPQGLELAAIVDMSKRVVQEARQVIAGMRPTVLDDFGLASALRQHVESLRAQGWNITYEAVVERLPPHIETALFRVAQEAFNNIHKHANTTTVRLTLYAEYDMIRMEIQDRGDGFDMLKTQHGSNGEHIGIAGMRERMALLDGHLHVQSMPGEGTTILAQAPLPMPSNDEATKDHLPSMMTAMAEQITQSKLPQHVAHIIIADDHDLSRAGIRTMLAGEPSIHIVGEATNGHDALALCRRLKPNIALLDIRMPGMDGIETTKTIKQESPNTSVIIVTMHEQSEYMVAAIRAGAAGYLLKDTSRREFLRAIRHVLQGESFLNTELTQQLLQHMSSEQKNQQPVLLEPLTPREMDVLRHLAKGLTNREIAKELIISPLTVKVHVQRIIAKLNASDRTHAAVRAMELHLL